MPRPKTSQSKPVAETIDKTILKKPKRAEKDKEYRARQKKEREKDAALMQKYRDQKAEKMRDIRARQKEEREKNAALMQKYQHERHERHEKEKENRENDPALMQKYRECSRRNAHEQYVKRSDALSQLATQHMEVIAAERALNDTPWDEQVGRGAAFLLRLLAEVHEQAKAEGKIALVNVFYAKPTKMLDPNQPEAYRPFMTRDVRRGLHTLPRQEMHRTR